MSNVAQRISYKVVWKPMPGPQSWLITCPVFETLFGGARGGGKTDGVLGEWIYHAEQYGSEAIGLCIRRERTQLIEMIERSKILFRPLGATFQEIDKIWRFPNGARLRFAYLESDSDAQSYQGHSYTRVYVEEMGTFPNPDPIFKLFATLGRNPKVPSRFIATANPGGPGHSWIKKRYIDPAPGGLQLIPTKYGEHNGVEIKKERIFIPSKVQDNIYTNTAEYVGNLMQSGNEELVKAWLHGDWDVMLGSFFPEWDRNKHIIRNFTPPKHWKRFMSMDWGSAKPFSVGWWCIVPDEYDLGQDVRAITLDDKNIYLPKNAIIRYKEWYGNRKDVLSPNTGLKLTAEEVALGINARERDEPKNDVGRPRISYRVLDPSAFRVDGGPSIAERMGKRPYKINFRKADNTRVSKKGALSGWDAVRARLKGDGEGRPMMYFMENCVDSIRTLPMLQNDEINIEDVDTEGEDHAPDEIRYACSSRPFSPSNLNTPVRDKIRNLDNSTAVLMDDLNTISKHKPAAIHSRI